MRRGAKYKKCNKCDKYKLIRYFYKNGHNKDGLYSSCKSCEKQRRTLPIPEGMKKCPSCKTIKPISEFQKSAKAKDGLKHNCKTCSSIYAAKYRKHKQRWDLGWRYGLTEIEYKELYNKQSGLCAICGGSQQGYRLSGKRKKLCVDHSHKTGVVRGLLCTRCNSAIGLLNDDAELLKIVLIYLEKDNTNEALC